MFVIRPKVFNTTLSKPIVEPYDKVTHLERTPLIIASSNGYYDVVEYLIQYCHVDINQTGTITVDERKFRGVSPIWCAAAFGHLTIVELLLNYGADMNLVSPLYSGPLYANDESSVGITPLMIAAIYGHQRIVEYFINYTNFFSKEQRIDALEVLGASLITKHSDCDKATTLWFRAFEERNQEPIVAKKIDPIRKQVYGNVLEVATESELIELIELDREHLKMQALMVYERILNRNLEFVCCVILSQARNDRVRSVDLLKHCLELLIRNHTVGTTSLEVCLLGVCRLIMFGHDSIFAALQLNANDMLRVIRKSIRGVQLCYNNYLKLKEEQSNNTADVLHHLNVVILNTFNFVFWFNRFITDSNEDDAMVRNFHDEITKLTRMNIRFKHNRNVLHQFIAKRNFGSSTLPTDEVVNVLLKCGMDPNDEDDSGNRALHYAAEYNCCLRTADLLLQFGAHYDAANLDGETYRLLIDICSTVSTPFIAANRFVTLQCLAAITIRKFDIPFESRIPCRLKDFVYCHSAIN